MLDVLTDYHTHTPLCKHAEGEPEQYVAQAISMGLAEYGIADHAPVLPEPFDDWRMQRDELQLYFEWIERARAAAGDKLKVRAGLECDWLSGSEEWIETLRAEYEWDYLIGSVHYIADQWDFDNPKWLGRWAETDVQEVWGIYWKTYEQMVRSKLFEIHAHADLIKKFGYKPEGDLRKYYEPVIQTLADTRGTIEINTAGWYKQCAEQYPEMGFLRLAAEAGVSLVISSDAHAPYEVGRDFNKAYALAKECGFTKLVRFSKGERREVVI